MKYSNLITLVVDLFLKLGNFRLEIVATTYLAFIANISKLIFLFLGEILINRFLVIYIFNPVSKTSTVLRISIHSLNFQFRYILITRLIDVTYIKSNINIKILAVLGRGWGGSLDIIESQYLADSKNWLKIQGSKLIDKVGL